MAEFTIDLSDEDVARITELAAKSGKSASSVIADAVANAKLLADNVDTKDDLLIKKGEKFLKVALKK